MTEQVVYELGLRDKMTGGIQGADSAVRKLEGSLGSVKGLLEGIGIGLAGFAVAEFFHSANEEWEKTEFAISQVEAGLKSTNEAAGLTFEELKKGAEDLSHNLKFTQADVLGMQSILLTFPAVTKEKFGEASEIILDMSTRLGQDLKSSAVQLGKALQDPEKGITALRRVGVNFNETQTEMIKKFAATNHMAEAQAMILKELQAEFGGSAAAAAEASNSFRLDKTMEENRVYLGKMLDELKGEFMPVLVSVAEAFADMLKWVKENGVWIKKLTVALGAAWVTFKLFTAGPAIFLTIENAIVAAATGTGLFTAALDSALGPIGLVAAAVGGLVYLYQSVGEEQEKLENQKKSDLERAGIAERQQLDASVEAYAKTMDRKAAIAEAKNVEIATIQANINSMQDQMDKDIAGDYSSYSQSEKGKEAIRQMNIANAQLKAAQQYDGLVPKTSGTKKPVTDLKVKPEKTKAVGSKSVTVNVTIQKLGETIINTTNIKEGAKQLHDHVVAALTGAVNDFQVVAQNS